MEETTTTPISSSNLNDNNNVPKTRLTGPPYSVAVIGIGAMGYGMASSLLSSPHTTRVVAYDKNTDAAQSFHAASLTHEKNVSPHPPQRLAECVTSETDVAIVVLVNESQCQSVCFGGGDNDNLCDLMREGSCVVVCSTVTATWCQKADEEFRKRGISFLDCPISGGPVRAADGTMTIIPSSPPPSSSSPAILPPLLPLLTSMGSDIHPIIGPIGSASTVKMVHQLLAGVHIVAAAEALALAAKAGLDCEQVYEIVNGAAGASWMFRDRARRMLDGDDEGRVCKSAVDIFVKDMGIVHAESRALRCPAPLATAALTQFLTAQAHDLGRRDDSQVVQVYEKITGVSVFANKKEMENDGQYWKMEDGSLEKIVSVANEPHHTFVLENRYAKVMRAVLDAGETTAPHHCDRDTLSIYLTKGGQNVTKHVRGTSPRCDSMPFGDVRYDNHSTSATTPLVQKITNGEKAAHWLDVTILESPPPLATVSPLVAEKHALVTTSDKIRVYKLTLG
eukprot:CAMPEP_0172514332 /NCGR_PEP_ID=MMETSP1066-20121228/259367_1 /TAXON_ID=671091 /ORGANISM="Coscinodiscus wailesii, Strain CCMP2513" /LENGTH=506 /DNA_ID=CAMNT_0013294959 /DNA_START=60 /DNA_END=1576 /DNA_ORIENTATION=+